MSIWKKITGFLKWAVAKPKHLKNYSKKDDTSAIIKRARNQKGQYKGDDESTPDINEAWEGGKAPSKK
jgi:hypothetical protein